MVKKSAALLPENKAAAPSSLPLFFSSPQPLDAARHKEASLLPADGFGFARNTNSMPLNAIEFIEAVKHYPIVFTGGENPSPVAILGFERDNYFVRKDGSWAPGAYIPAYARQYPFIFSENPRQKKMYLCIDEAAAGYRPTPQPGAEPLYNANGKPSKLSNHALEFCTAFYRHHTATRAFCNGLQEYKLLAPYQSEATLTSGRKLTLSGFHIIDEKALSSLPDKQFLELRKQGWLPLIYLSLASTSNWKRLADIAA